MTYEPLSIEQRIERQTWQYRAVAATGGNTTRLGTILLAILGKRSRHPPFLVGGATITDAGVVTCDGVILDNRSPGGTAAVRDIALCYVTELRDNFRRLADHMALSDKDRTALFDEIIKWVKLDLRPRDKGKL